MTDTLTAPAPATDAAPVTSTPGVTPQVTPQVAPANQEPAVSTPPTPATPSRPLTKREARASLHQSLKATSTPAVSAPASSPVSEAPATEAPAAVPEAVSTSTTETVPAPAPTPETAVVSPVTPEVAPKPPATPAAILVEIGADHPAARGRLVTLAARSQEEADALRALVNGTYYRVRDVTERDTKIAELTEKLARRESQDVAQGKWQQTPEYKKAVEEYHNIRETVGPEAASRYWKGIEADFQHLADAEFRERWGRFEEETITRAAQVWTEDAQRRAASWVPRPIRDLPDYDSWFQAAVRGFDAEIGAGNYPELREGDVEGMHKEFVRYFQTKLAGKDNARAALKAASARQQQDQASVTAQATLAKQKEDRLKLEAVEAYKRSLAENRQAAPPHPLGAAGAGVAQPAPTVGTGNQAPDLSGLPPHELKRTLRNQSREASRRFLTGRRP